MPALSTEALKALDSVRDRSKTNFKRNKFLSWDCNDFQSSFAVQFISHFSDMKLNLLLLLFSLLLLNELEDPMVKGQIDYVHAVFIFSEEKKMDNLFHVRYKFVTTLPL